MVDVRLYYMPWNKSRNGTLVYILKEMVNGEVVRRYAGSGEAGLQAELEVRRQRFLKRELRHREFEIHELLNQYEKLVRAVIDESLLNYGYVKRPDRRWAKIARCRK